MKINRVRIGIALVCIVLFVMILTACNQQKEYEYYSDKSNFISVTAQIYFVNYAEDDSSLYLAFSGLPDNFSDDCFKVTGENWDLIKKENLDDKIKIGKEMTFITAPQYFGDGYVMPIVGIVIDGDVLLDFEMGYMNFMKQYE